MDVEMGYILVYACSCVTCILLCLYCGSCDICYCDPYILLHFDINMCFCAFKKKNAAYARSFQKLPFASKCTYVCVYSSEHVGVVTWSQCRGI